LAGGEVGGFVGARAAGEGVGTGAAGEGVVTDAAGLHGDRDRRGR
jgi:hypothetical protein